MSKITSKKTGRRPKNVVSKFNYRRELSPNVSEVTSSELSSIIKMTKMTSQTDTYTIKMIYDATVTTDGSGVYAVTYSDDPSVDSNWAAAASFFDEYRVLGMSVKFSPNVTSGGSLLTYAPIVLVTDYDSSSMLTGYTLASQYSSCKEYKGNAAFTFKAVMSGLENGTFISTASHAARWWVKVYSSGNSASTVIGRVQITHIVQYRGKGI